MRRNVLLICALLMAVAMLSGCSVTDSYTRINAFDLEVPSAPDMHGANGYMNPSESHWRFSGDVNIHKEESISRGGYGTYATSRNFGDCGKMKFPEEKVNDNFVRKSMDYFTGEIEYLSKTGLARDTAAGATTSALFSIGIGYRQGVLVHAGIGINSKYFEIGATIGLWDQYRELNYSSTRYECCHDLWTEDSWVDITSYGNNDNGTTLVGTYGGYLSAFYGPAFFTFSVSTYTPVMTLTTKDTYYKHHEYMDEHMPRVITEYFTLGYRISKMVEVHAGASNMLGEFEGWHWGATGGVSLYL